MIVSIKLLGIYSGIFCLQAYILLIIKSHILHYSKIVYFASGKEHPRHHIVVNISIMVIHSESTIHQGIYHLLVNIHGTF
jgi:hypothetical protein